MPWQGIKGEVGRNFMRLIKAFCTENGGSRLEFNLGGGAGQDTCCDEVRLMFVHFLKAGDALIFGRLRNRCGTGLPEWLRINGLIRLLHDLRFLRFVVRW